ncbi:hypothetical protein [Haloarcula montana]|uniref:hypothetical protein n=1 Tax=Haloarcula montana TaxID=3111776 RepID=UPI002D76934D|nr:hypothetical protein [Haloarcula sp. GH36]
MVVVGTDDPHSVDAVDLHHYDTRLADYDGDADTPSPDPEDVAGHYYTGGTTASR